MLTWLLIAKSRTSKSYGWTIWNLDPNISIKCIFDLDLFWISTEGHTTFEKKNPCHNMKILKIKDFNLVPLIEDIKRNLILPEFFSWPIFRIFKVIFEFFILGFKLSTAWIKTPSHKYIHHLISLQPYSFRGLCIYFLWYVHI